MININVEYKDSEFKTVKEIMEDIKKRTSVDTSEFYKPIDTDAEFDGVMVLSDSNANVIALVFKDSQIWACLSIFDAVDMCEAYNLVKADINISF